MKNLIPAMLAVAITCVPLGATAGEPYASAPGGHMPSAMVQRLGLTAQQQQAWQQIMTHKHQQMAQLHQQARTKILASLTPAHRALLSQIVGSLATSANPDEAAAARQLDAALSPGEAQAVIATHTAAFAQMRALRQAAHQRLNSILTAQQRAQMQMPEKGERAEAPGGQMENNMKQLTAGQILLHFEGAKGHPDGPGMGHE
jgi:Spy/CpxP family protein refolding chaperone